MIVGGTEYYCLTIPLNGFHVSGVLGLRRRLPRGLFLEGLSWIFRTVKPIIIAGLLVQRLFGCQ